jgi:hypothetical protein
MSADAITKSKNPTTQCIAGLLVIVIMNFMKLNIYSKNISQALNQVNAYNCTPFYILTAFFDIIIIPIIIPIFISLQLSLYIFSQVSGSVL